MTTGLVSELTPYGVLLLIVLMICFGLLIPRWSHVQRINDYKEQIKLLREIVQRRDRQLLLLLQPGQVAVKMLEEIKEVVTTQ